MGVEVSTVVEADRPESQAVSRNRPQRANGGRRVRAARGSPEARVGTRPSETADKVTERGAAQFTDFDATPVIATPKLAAQVAGLGYHYYAGFSPDFVGDVLKHLGATKSDIVIDPWNGSGTTTLVCAKQGIPSTGFDLSPAMVVVSKGRLYSASVEQVAHKVHNLVTATPPQRRPNTGEPLCAWFEPASAARLRWFIERLTGQTGKVDPDKMSPEICFLTTALFLTVRSFMGAAMTSNPTWIRRQLSDKNRARATWTEFVKRFKQAASDIERPLTPIKAWPDLHVADTSMTLNDPVAIDVNLAVGGSLDRSAPGAGGETDSKSPVQPTVLITSPPYCTRIDYVASTRPELATLGWVSADQEVLRRRMLGTTTVAEKLERAEGFGVEAEQLLEKVTNHGSRASATYYRKWLGQYLDAYQRSIQVLAATLAPGGRAALVVQDSFYKDIHIDLARITHEMCEAAGWRHESTIAFFVPRTMASINPRSRPYRERATVTESLLLFRAPET